MTFMGKKVFFRALLRLNTSKVILKIVTFFSVHFLAQKCTENFVLWSLCAQYTCFPAVNAIQTLYFRLS